MAEGILIVAGGPVGLALWLVLLVTGCRRWSWRPARSPLLARSRGP